MKRRVAVRAIVVKDGKVLCAKLKPYRGAIPGDFWCTIGGGIDPGEGLVDALKREVFEETGVQAQVGPLLYIQQFAHDDTEHLEFFFLVTNTEDFEAIDVANTTHGATEIKTIDFIDCSKEVVLPAFLRHETFDTVLNQPTKLFNYFSEA